MVPRSGEFGIARSFVYVGDRPGLHVLLKERFALGGIFLSGDLEQFLSGVSQLFAVGGKVPMLGKARRSSQVGSASSRLRLPEMLPAKPKSRTESQPRVPGGRWPGWDTHRFPGHWQCSGADPGTAKPCAGWCSTGKSPGQTGCASERAAGAGSACAAAPEVLLRDHASTVHTGSSVRSPWSRDLL